MVDAVRSGAAPGTVVTLDACCRSIPTNFFHYSTHAFSLAEGIEVARRLHRLPSGLLVIGIEGASFAPGELLTDQVARSVQPVVDRIMSLFRTAD